MDIILFNFAHAKFEEGQMSVQGLMREVRLLIIECWFLYISCIYQNVDHETVMALHDMIGEHSNEKS